MAKQLTAGRGMREGGPSALPSSFGVSLIRGHVGLVLVLVCVVCFAVVMVRTAWVCEDAYITLRTVDNFVHGYGLRWNVAERVQTYTHPLWMLLLAAAYAVTRESYYTTAGLCMAVSMATVLLLGLRVSRCKVAGGVAVAALTLSKAFVEYSTSGLGNPLTHLLLVLFVWVYVGERAWKHRVVTLSLLAAAGTLCRMDAVLLYGPALVWAVVERRRWGDLWMVALGLSPVLVWECFSLIYYGFLFPNTAYAKLGTGIARGDLLRQGVFYLSNSARWDPLTLLCIAAGCVLPLARRQWRSVPVASGVALYVSYVVWVGGDFMSGRFLTAPLVCAVVLVVMMEWRRPGWVWGSCLAGVLAIGLMGPRCPVYSGSDYGVDRRDLTDGHGIADERGHWYQGAGLLRARRGEAMPMTRWAKEGRQARRRGAFVTARAGIGYFGFFAGPKAYIVDTLALADPLLARLPTKHLTHWRIGHFARAIPTGYMESLQSSRNLIVDPDLAAYYEKLRLIINGPLLDGDRWAAIWELNGAKGRAMIAGYVGRHPPMVSVNSQSH